MEKKINIFNKTLEDIRDLADEKDSNNIKVRLVTITEVALQFLKMIDDNKVTAVEKVVLMDMINTTISIEKKYCRDQE